MLNLFSIIVLSNPIAFLLKAKGSFELVGFSLIPKKPTKKSILSIGQRFMKKIQGCYLRRGMRGYRWQAGGGVPGGAPHEHLRRQVILTKPSLEK